MTFGTGTPPAVLVDLLGDADPDVRLRAALELGESRHDPAAPAIVDRFGRERDFYIRETLTWAALRMPVAALPHVRDALASPRCANLGRHPKTGGITYLSEAPQADPVFTWTNGLSDKLGVVQLAGINTLNGQVFAAADPRGSGVALAV